MSHCLSNMATVHNPTSSFPLSSKASIFNPLYENFPRCLMTLSYPLGGVGKRSIKALAAAASDGRNNLDYLQIASNKPQQPQPQSPKKRSSQYAPIGLWDRFPTARTVQQMMDTMERIMEDPLAYSNGGGWPSPLTSETGGYSRGRTPWEIKEFGGEYKMRFDMPGMTKEDVKVWVEEKMLVVKAEKEPKKKNGNSEEEDDSEDWSAKSYGRYSCRIALPENVDFEKIKAEVKDGVLYITIPKASGGSKILGINVE